MPPISITPISDGIPDDLRIRVNHGDAEAQHELAKCYFNGFFVPKDERKATRLWRRAADQDHANAQLNLARCYMNGLGVPKDRAEGARLFRLAAEQDLAEAQCSFGLCLEQGKGVEQDLVEAVRYYRLSAEQNYALARYSLGKCLENGIGVAKDEVEAVRYFSLAAVQDHGPAQLEFGRCLELGKGVAHNMLEAEVYYRLAIHQGVVEAHYRLGVLLLTSTSPAAPRSPKEGALSLARAAQQTEEEDIARLALACLSEHAHERDVVHSCCIGCGKARSLKVCSKCHVAKFCGAACVRRMWPVHKPSCVQWAGETAATPAADAAPAGSSASAG